MGLDPRPPEPDPLPPPCGRHKWMDPIRNSKNLQLDLPQLAYQYLIMMTILNILMMILKAMVLTRLMTTLMAVILMRTVVTIL